MADASATRQKLRSEIRRHLIGEGVPADCADEVVDLAFHASDVAKNSLLDIVAPARNFPVMTAALSTAVGILQAELAAISEAQQKYIATNFPDARTSIFKSEMANG